MCAAVYSSLLLLVFTTLTISIMCGTKMATEGLPLVRRERGADPDLLAGTDFLSVFMESSLRRAYRETTTPESSIQPTTSSSAIDLTLTDEAPYIRTSRSTSYITSTDVSQTTTEDQSSLYDTTFSAQLKQLNGNEETSDSSLNDGVIVAVRVSSSVGRTLINKRVQQTTELDSIEDTTLREGVTETVTYPTTELSENNFIPSEEHQSLLAEANKSEFSVEETEPITSNSDSTSSHYSRSFPASVHALPRAANFPFNPTDFLSQTQTNSKDKLQPFHQTVIYHNNPREPGRARSVSYSTVIQAVPHSENDKNWEEQKPQHDRHERHYETSQHSYNNKFEKSQKINETSSKFSPQGSVAETKNYFVTTSPVIESNKPITWEQAEENYEQQSSTKKTLITTERNWEVHEKSYESPVRPLPKVYGRPEENYEVDEAVSVMTNGRAHGVQPSQTPYTTKDEANKSSNDSSKKDDDNQKVGYVVEGRNYRKYRVEERTADGFIVGEYGVVSHDDGSLRGVRYTADGTINPRLIYDALMKFLSL